MRSFDQLVTGLRHADAFHTRQPSTARLLRALVLSVVVAGSCARAGEPAGPDSDTVASEQAEGQNVQEIDVRGIERLEGGEGTVLRLIRTRKGRPFDSRVWADDWRRLEQSGYFLDVRITEPIISPGGIKLVIDLIVKGLVSKIEFRGNKSVSAAKLLALIKSYEGGRFDKPQVHLDKLAIEKYYQDRAFRGVTVSYAVETVSSHRQEIAGKEVDVDDEVRIVFTIDEGNPVGVRTIQFVGNKAFSESQLRLVMATKYRRLFRAGDLKDEEIEIDQKRVEAFYLRNGYMDVAVQKVEIDLSKETYWNWFRKRKRLANITIHIDEGPQYHTGQVKISGHATLDREEIESVMKIKPGAVYSDLLLQEDHDRIRDLYGERGRVFSRIRYGRKLVTDPDRTGTTANLYDVEIEIDEGAEVTLREVITRGNTKTRDKVIIRQLELYPGDRVDTTKVRIATQRLKNLNYFEDDVRITPEPTENPEEANLIIDVTEKNTGEFNFGAGVSSVDSVMGQIKLTQRNFDYRDLPKSWRDFISGNSFVGAGQTFNVEATAGAKRQRYSLSFFEPWAFDRPVRVGGTLFRSVDNNFADFDQTSTGINLTVGKRLWGPRWDGSLNYRFSFNEISDIKNNFPPILRNQQGDRILSSLTPRLVYDSRDSTMLPSRGWLVEASVEVGGGPFLGDYDWFKPMLDVSRFITMYKTKGGGKHILELHGRAGMIEAYGDTDDVPPFQRFYAGGIDTIRGFQYRTITPRENRFQIGGKKMVIGSAEYSLPLYEEVVRGSVFVDAGSVWDAGDTDPRTRVTNESGVRAAAGVGLAIRTPLSPLPIRVYFTRAFVRNDEDKVKTFDFTFGTRF